MSSDTETLQKTAQREISNSTYAAGSRTHVTSDDPLTQYIVRWRLHASMQRIGNHLGSRLLSSSPILFLCAGEGGEASWLCDLGFTDVTFSDLSPVAVKQGVARDARLKGAVLDAENLTVPEGSFDLAIVQDGLHHLPSPVRGFTEMLRVARLGALFIEPHNSLPGRVLGTKWERNGDAINYVFRWTRGLVEDIASSYLGPGTFDNLSFSYWHHNPLMHRAGSLLGAPRLGIQAIAAIKWSLDHMPMVRGNQFSGIVLKR